MSRPVLVLVLVGAVFRATAYPTGAPAEACVSMKPNHSPHEDSSSVLPFETTLNRVGIFSNETLNVVIQSKDGTALFKGFLLMAIDEKTNRSLGQFRASGDGKSQLLSCYDEINSAVTHTDDDFKTSVAFQWTPPQGFDGTIKFWTTYVQSFSIYWVKRPTGTVRITASEQAPATSPPPTTLPTEIPNVETGCGATKGCLVLPSETCHESGTCTTVVSHKKIDEATVEIEIFSKNVAANRYVAVGFSSDKKMGDDSVAECVYYNGRPNSFQSFNSPAKSNQRINTPTPGFEVISSSYINGDLYCKLKHPVVYELNNVQFNLTRPYYILLAFGQAADGSSITKHNQVQLSTSQVAVSEDNDVIMMGDGERELKQAHGALMVIAWLVSGSIGLVMPRYMKKTWVGKQFYKKDMWFVYHRALMLLTWTLTMTGFIIIFVDVGGWVSDSISENPHPLIGCITTGLAFIQPIMAYFRPAPNAPKRYIFNWAHMLVGYSAHTLALTCIFLAVEMDEAQLPFYTYWVLTAHVVCYVGVQITFTLLARRNASVMAELKNDELRDEPGSSVRRNILILYAIIMLGLGFTVVGFIASS